MKAIRLAIFVSGKGTNARNIIEYFKGNNNIDVVVLCTNNIDSGAAPLATEHHFPLILFTRNDFYATDEVVKKLQALRVTHIVLAGFLWLVPANILTSFKDKIINIHPALLPKFGGKGMYGMHVHQAVKEAGELETGITIHLVNEKYDEGEYFCQQKITLSGAETAQEISNKVQALEHACYPKEIETWVNKK